MYETNVFEGQTQLRHKPGLLPLKLMQVLSAYIQSRSSLKKPRALLSLFMFLSDWLRIFGFKYLLKLFDN